MTLDNKKFFRSMQLIVVVTIVAIVLDLVLSQLSGQIGSIFKQHWIAIVGSITLILFKLLNISYFEYEAEYEIVHINSKPLLESLIFKNKGNKFEFPKRLVHRVKMKRSFLQNKLVVYIKTSQGIRKAGEFYLTGIPQSKVKKLLVDGKSKNNSPKKSGSVKLHSVA